MRLLIILFISLLILRSAVYGQVGATSDSSQGRVSIKLKIDTANWQWDISITNIIPDSYIKLYQPGLESFTSSFKLYDSSLREMTSRCIIVDHFVQRMPHTKSKAKKITNDSTANMTMIEDILRVSSGNYLRLDKYFCRINPKNLIEYSFSTPVIVYNKQNGNEIGHVNLSFSTKMNVSQSKIMADSASFPFVPK
jgi:hypothetical protein